MLQFLQDYYIFIITVTLTVALLIAAYFLYNRQYHKDFPAIKKTKSKETTEKKVNTHFVEPVKELPIIENDVKIIEEPVTVIEESKTLESINVTPIDAKENPVTKVDEPTNKDSIASIEESLVDTEALLEDKEPKKKKALGKYHIIYRQVDQMWVIKREGSDKIIRSLHTQREAIAYATIKALSQDTTFVIHKKDGKIRKQNYSKTDK